MNAVTPRMVIWGLIAITSVAVLLYAVYADMPYPGEVASDTQSTQSTPTPRTSPTSPAESAPAANTENTATAPAPAAQNEGAAAVDSVVRDLLADGDASAEDFAAADESADVEESTQVDETEPLYQ